MPSDLRLRQGLARLEARLEWVIQRLEALDARLIALAGRTRRSAPKRPPNRAVVGGDESPTRRRSPSAKVGRRPRRP